LSSAPASAVINLVHQAAEIFGSVEDHARETEARAQSLCKSALERLELGEKRIETVERERREAINKLREAAKALEEAQSRIIAAEDLLTALEFRAQAAEAEARDFKQALALVEQAIRNCLFSISPKAARSLGNIPGDGFRASVWRENRSAPTGAPRPLASETSE
jgi:chromosome segregation ATPase